MNEKNELSIFDRMMTEMTGHQECSDYLDTCMSLRPNLIKKVPLRYRLIALGFVKKYSLEELNRTLREAGCAGLYSRNLWEASLIYAFKNHLSFFRWKELQHICQEFLDSSDLENPYFRDNNITLAELIRYVSENSSEEEQIQATRHLTHFMEKQLTGLQNDQEQFRQFVQNNLHAFSLVREKTRYYFCKYLIFYLEDKINRYIATLKKHRNPDSAIADLMVFKGITNLKKQPSTKEAVYSYFLQCGISCGNIFDSFNYYFFEYVSLDWLEILLEYYGNLENLPPEEKEKLAVSLKHHDRALAGMSTEEVIAYEIRKQESEEEKLDEIYSASGTKKGYQRNRSGEHTLRKYIKGALDIDRTTFLSFLLFFGKNTDLTANYTITEERLNSILLECGFSALTQTEPFDLFVIRFLQSDAPEDFLMEEVTRYALNEENFFLYNMFKSSVSNEQELRKLLNYHR